MAKAPPLARPNARAADSDVHRMTGQSGPAAPPGHHHIRYSRLGDHRDGGNFHTGSKNSSKPPTVMAGVPRTAGFGNGNGGNGNG
jgi:hypothetical protein